MPSLSALKEFRDSFSEIANERESLLKNGLPYEAFELPDTEPPPFDPMSQMPAASDGTFSDPGDDGFDINSFLTDMMPPQDASSKDEVSSFDDIFSDLVQPVNDDPGPMDDFFKNLGSPPEESPPLDESPIDDLLNDFDSPPTESTAPDEDPMDIDFSTPDGLLSGLAD